jgi:hypothetical protein
MFVVRLLSNYIALSCLLVGLSHCSMVEDKYRPRFRGYDEGQIDADGQVEGHILEEMLVLEEVGGQERKR